LLVLLINFIHLNNARNMEHVKLVNFVVIDGSTYVNSDNPGSLNHLPTLNTQSYFGLGLSEIY
jgi:hypothetical protein